MDTKAGTYQLIKNMTCLVCGTGFTTPRAGKFYCSPRCKQFAYYHQDELKAIQQAKNSVKDLAVHLSLKDYEAFKTALYQLDQYDNLLKKQRSTYQVFEPSDAVQLKNLENLVPLYLRKLDPPWLTIEEWSFIKLLYPSLKKEEFIKLLCSLDKKFFENLIYPENTKFEKEKSNPIKNLYQNHLVKIAEGRIKFL
jgi:hypothetical protein